MPSSAGETRRERVNLLLPSPFDTPGLRAALRSDDRAERREAVAEVEGLESTYRRSNADLAFAICARLSGSQTLESVSQDSGRPFLSIDELDPYVGPPESIPVLNPYTAVMTLAGPEGAEPEESLRNVHEQVADLVPEAEMTASYRAVAAMDRSLVVDPEIFEAARPPTGFWLEAALETGEQETIPWGILQIGAQKAWEMGVTGQGIAVAVVDTGIAPHLDLPQPIRGFSFIPGSQSFYDDHGHGTHVAGTIGARRNNGRGVVGVAPGVDLIAVKVLARDGFSRGDSVAQGITWAANNGARIINLSLGSRDQRESMNRAVLYAQSRHVVVCAAAGNDYGSPVSYPAAFRDICIAVAATDRNNRRAVFSNIGPEMDIAAPGVEVLSTSLSNSYRTLQGTSMATPHVSGAVALLLAQNPVLAPSGLRERLQRSALGLGRPDEFGSGLIQVDRALALPAAPIVAIVAPPPLPPESDEGGVEATPAAAPRRLSTAPAEAVVTPPKPKPKPSQTAGNVTKPKA